MKYIPTKREFELLFFIYNNNGKTTTNEQEVFKSNQRFYCAIERLRSANLISSYVYKDELIDSRFNIYELTLRAIQLLKILNGEHE